MPYPGNLALGYGSKKYLCLTIIIFSTCSKAARHCFWVPEIYQSIESYKMNKLLYNNEKNIQINIQIKLLHQALAIVPLFYTGNH